MFEWWNNPDNDRVAGNIAMTDGASPDSGDDLVFVGYLDEGKDLTFDKTAWDFEGARLEITAETPALAA